MFLAIGNISTEFRTGKYGQNMARLLVDGHDTRIKLFIRTAGYVGIN